MKELGKKSIYLSESRREMRAMRPAAWVHRKCPPHHSVMSGTGQTVQTKLEKRQTKGETLHKTQIQPSLPITEFKDILKSFNLLGVNTSKQFIGWRNKAETSVFLKFIANQQI